MKNLLLLFTAVLCFNTAVYSQIPDGNEGINYQAVARDGAGTILSDADLTVTISIYSGTLADELEYSETHDVTTNTYGMFNLVIGEGTPAGAEIYDDVRFKDDQHWMEVAILEIGTGTLTTLPKQSFQSVPYAHISNCADTANFAFSSSISIIALLDSVNNLDQAYDKGGPGAGRMIDVDSGPVELTGSMDSNVLEVWQFSDDEDALVVESLGDGHAVAIGNAGGSSITIDDTAETGDNVIDVTSSGDGDVINIWSTGDGDVIEIDSDGTGDAMYMLNSGGHAIQILDDSDTTDFYLLSTGAYHAFDLDKLDGGSTININHHTDSSAIHVRNESIVSGTYGEDNERNRAGYFENASAINNRPAIEGNNRDEDGIGVLGFSGDRSLNFSMYSSTAKAGVAGLTRTDDGKGVHGIGLQGTGVLGHTAYKENEWEGLSPTFRAGVIGEVIDTVTTSQNEDFLGFGVIGSTTFGSGVLGYTENDHGVVGISKGTASGHTQTGVWAMTQDGGWTQHSSDYKYKDEVYSKDEVALLAQSKSGTGSWHESIAGIGLVATQGSYNSLDSLKNLIACDPTGTPTKPPTWIETDSLTRAGLVVKSTGSTSYPAVISSGQVTDKPTLLIESRTKSNVDHATAALQIANLGSGSGIRIDNKAATDPDTNQPSSRSAMRINHHRDGIGMKLDMINATANSNFISANSNAAGGSTAVFTNGAHTDDAEGLENFKENTDAVLKSTSQGKGPAAEFKNSLNEPTNTAYTLVSESVGGKGGAGRFHGSADTTMFVVEQTGTKGTANFTMTNPAVTDTAFKVLNLGKGTGFKTTSTASLIETANEFIYRGSPQPMALDLSWVTPADWITSIGTLISEYNSISTRTGRVAHFKQDVQVLGSQLAANEAVLIESNVGSEIDIELAPFSFSIPNPLAISGLLKDHYALVVDSYNSAKFTGNVDMPEGIKGIKKKGSGGGGGGFAPNGLLPDPEVDWSKYSIGSTLGPAAYFEMTEDAGETKDLPTVLAINYDDGSAGIFAVGDSLVTEDMAIGNTALTAYSKKEDPGEGGDPTLSGTIFNSANLAVDDGPAGQFLMTPHTTNDNPTIKSVNLNDGHAGLFTVGDTISDDWAKLYPTSIASFYKKDDIKPYWNRALINMKDGPAAHFDMTEEMGNRTPTLVSQNQSAGPAGAFILGDSLLTSDYLSGPPSAIFSAFKMHEPGTVDPFATKDVFNVAQLNIAGGSAAYLDVTPASYPKPVPTAVIQNRAEGHAAYLMVGDSIRDIDFAMDTAAALAASWQKIPTGSVDPLDPAVAFSRTLLNQKGGPAGYFEIPPNDMVSLPALHATNQSGGLGGLFTVGEPLMKPYEEYMGFSAGLMAGMKVSETPDSMYHNLAILGIDGGHAGFFEIRGGMEEDPMKMAPTIEVKNSAKGMAGIFHTADSSNVMPTVYIDNHGTSNTLEVKSTWGDAKAALLVIKEEDSFDGDATTGRLADFYLDAPASDVDCAVNITSSVLTPGHVALKVIPADAFSDAASFEGNVDIAGDITFDAFTSMDFGPSSTITAGTGGLIDITSVLTGDVTTDALTVTAAGAIGTDLSVGGDLSVVGSISKGSGTFKIDHPLDPYNKYLYHSFVESPDMMNIYNGNITTDEEGYASVVMPEYFEALNMDFRYQLTVIGAFAQAIVLEEIEGNQFRIQTDSPNVKVSWQVTGVRQDTYARQNRVQVEVDKEPENVGTLLYEPVLEK